MFTLCVTEGPFWISTVPLLWTWVISNGPVLGSSNLGTTPGLVRSTLVLYMVLMFKSTFVLFSVGSIDLSRNFEFWTVCTHYGLWQKLNVDAKRKRLFLLILYGALSSLLRVVPLIIKWARRTGLDGLRPKALRTCTGKVFLLLPPAFSNPVIIVLLVQTNLTRLIKTYCTTSTN